MAYDRFDPRYDREGGRQGRERASHGRPRWPDDDSRRWRGEGGRDEDRGWFERAGDQIASWFGDDDEDDGRRGGRDWNRDDTDRQTPWGSRNREPWGGGQFERDRDRDRQERERGYRPMAGDYGRTEGMMSRGGGWSSSPRNQRHQPQQQQGMHDPHYHNWRQRQMEELDRDYDEYRRENQSRFESEFGSWRERRQQKRSMLGGIREQMEVVGNDDQPIGTVDRVAGDRIILAKSDPQDGGHHHSISCGNIDRIEDNRVILDCSADHAKQSWRDDDRSRGLNEREDQGEVGPHILNRSFEGTYR
jgi:hypothetical protein